MHDYLDKEYLCIDFDLIEYRKMNGLLQKDIMALTKLSKQSIIKFERAKKIPLFVYEKLSKKYPKTITLPTDFYHYTSISLRTNAVVYGYTMDSIAEKLGFSITETRYLYYADVFLYNLKDKFSELFPTLIIPCIEGKGRKKYELLIKGTNWEK